MTISTLISEVKGGVGRGRLALWKWKKTDHMLPTQIQKY